MFDAVTTGPVRRMRTITIKTKKPKTKAPKAKAPTFKLRKRVKGKKKNLYPNTFPSGK